MIIKCSKCGKKMGKKEPLEDKSIVHSICPECKQKFFGVNFIKREGENGKEVARPNGS